MVIHATPTAAAAAGSIYTAAQIYGTEPKLDFAEVL
jgi:hypothetical protein